MFAVYGLGFGVLPARVACRDPDAVRLPLEPFPLLPMRGVREYGTYKTDSGLGFKVKVLETF